MPGGRTSSTTARTSGESPHAQAQGAGNRDRIDFGRVYSATISAVNPGHESYTARVDGTDMLLDDCRSALGLFCGLLGFKFHTRLTIGTRVLAVGNHPAFIIACINTTGSAGVQPRQVGMGTTEETPDVTDTAPGEITDAGMWASYGTPIDLLEGEFEISNLMGVAAQFLTNMLRLQGSERAKIEMHLTRDLVRVVSKSFQHFSNFGNEEIDTDGGRVNVRFNGTSYEHEAWGAVKENDKKAAVSKDEIDLGSVAETGRWRVARYFGYLGDFMQFFIMDPEKAIGQIAQTNAGKSRVMFHSDGSILFQSVADIALERVTRVLVPVEKKTSHDPAGDDAETVRALNSAYLKLWPFGDMQDAYKSPYQLREYARWLSQFHGYARFHKLSKDWDVPGESASPAPAWQNNEEDREQADTTPYYAAYACYRIMRDGSLVSLAGDGSAIVHTAGNIQVSAPRNLTIEAGGDIRIIAGRNIFMKARRNIEIVSILGGLITKARTLWRALVEKGTMYLKSDAAEGDNGDGTPPQEVLDKQAIIIDAPNAGVKIVSKKKVVVTSEEDNIELRANKEMVGVYVRKNFEVNSIEGDLVLKGKRLFLSAREYVAFECPLFDINNAVTWSLKNGFNTSRIRADQISAVGSIFGPKVGPQAPEGGGGEHVPEHYNHIQAIKAAQASNYAPVYADKQEELRAALQDIVAYEKLFEQDVKWHFYDQDKYIAKGDEKESLFQSLSQQRMESDNSLSSWSWQEDRLKGANRTANELPFPANNNTQLVHSSSMEQLNQLSSKNPKAMDHRSDLRPQPVSFKVQASS